MLVTTLCFAITLATPARADSGSGKLQLSWDDTTWSTQLSGTLFDQANGIRVWVPGDHDTEHLYVRNNGGDAARLAVDYDLPPNGLVGPDDVVLTATVDGGQPVTLTPGQDWLPLGGSQLADGRHADVAVTATFRPSSTNQSETKEFPIDFRVTLTEINGPSPDTHGGSGTPAGSSAGHGGGLLPNTGAPEIRWAVGLGLLSLGGGLVIVVLARRRQRDAEAS